jgi:hypothetical protein
MADGDADPTRPERAYQRANIPAQRVRDDRGGGRSLGLPDPAVEFHGLRLLPGWSASSIAIMKATVSVDVQEPRAGSST